jgi:hypothetical protein
MLVGLCLHFILSIENCSGWEWPPPRRCLICYHERSGLCILVICLIDKWEVLSVCVVVRFLQQESIYLFIAGLAPAR